MQSNHIAGEGQRDNLRALRTESLTALALFAGIAAYIWFSLTVWPITGHAVTPVAWIGVIGLLLSTYLSYRWRHRRFQLAAHVLVWGTFGATLAAVTAFRLPDLTYLFILPVTFASVLLGRGVIFMVAAGSGLSLLFVNQLVLGMPHTSIEFLLPMGIISTVAFASWLAARNLYTALAWVWNGYERARQNERLAREHQGELRRVLKALDETNYRIERANYQATLARDEAIEARRLKQQFAQNISHELRTPLNLIVGFAELMIRSPEYYGSQLPPAYLRDLSIIHRNATHLQTLVNDVLDLARIESAQMTLIPEMTDPATLVTEAINTARSLVETRGLALRTAIEPDLPPLWLDPTRIRQVLFNLLNNAARFTEMGSITVSVYRREEAVIFSVADTGIGIPAQDLPHIFREFHQIDAGTRRRHSGAGLGLAISQRFVKLHGGRIWVESQVGAGSTFYFSIPTHQDRADAPPLGQIDHNSRDNLLAPQEERVLLVVTASSAAATLLTRYIRGYRTVVVRDLVQAEQAARQLLPQAVLLDAISVDMGSESIAPLSQRWRLTQTLFLLCPLPGEEPMRQRLAVDGYLIKPITRRSLLDVVRRFGEAVESVLVVDDNQDFVRLVRRLLDSSVRHYQVMAAYRGDEALALLEHRRPGLMLLDLTLPDMTGVQVLETIRANPAAQHLPIVIITGQDELGHLESLRGELMVTRPDGITPGELVGWIQQILDRPLQDAEREQMPLHPPQAPVENASPITTAGANPNPSRAHRA